MNPTHPLFLSVALLFSWTVGTARGADPRPLRVVPKMPDIIELPSPSATELAGFLGARVEANEKNRLVNINLEPLLAGFKSKPGSHPWIGEHIGKWMHAATLAWANSGDLELRKKLDYAANELVKAQEPDGYLGTYVPEKRFGLYPDSDWDVWSHKYDLMGLLTYYQYTGDEPSLQACRKIGDLMINTFGPGKKSILSAGTHVGMAATSILEPMVLLYRLTADERYLQFATYLVNAWDEPNGPHVLKTLLEGKGVQKTANGKAYEMLSNLVGLCELARVTGEAPYLQAAINAWSDIVSHRLYLTGSASQGEHFHDDFSLPNQEGANVAETCVTTTWIQLNSQLLRLTGETRFADELEKTFYNHLSAAQRPDGAQWCYFTSLEGKKPYGPGINCCVSSGPRGMALVPQHAWLRARDGGKDQLVLNLFDRSKVSLPLNGSPVSVDFRSEFPRQGVATLIFGIRQPASFGLCLREPSWAAPITAEINGKSLELTRNSKGWMACEPRVWNNADVVTLHFTLTGRMITGDHGNQDKAALAWGPFVLAYDDQRNSELPKSSAIGLVAVNAGPILSLEPGPELTLAAKIRVSGQPEPVRAKFVPFADAGRNGGGYRVWLRAPGVAVAQNRSVLSGGHESRSRSGNVDGSINDDDPASFVVTYNGRKVTEDWFAITMSEAVKIKEFVYVPGKIFHDGGWFDSTQGKPRIQIQRTKNGTWETIGELSSYPATTATNPAGLGASAEQCFTLRLGAPTPAFAVRVVGAPASGDNSAQAFSSCAELLAYAD